jgi:hypothetical protein
MDRVILSQRLQTLERFLNKIENSKKGQEWLTAALEASEISDKIQELTPKYGFTPDEYQVIIENLELFSLAVFSDNIEWARACLNSVKNSSVNYF